MYVKKFMIKVPYIMDEIRLNVDIEYHFPISMIYKVHLM